jgi:hypothetical protein
MYNAASLQKIFTLQAELFSLFRTKYYRKVNNFTIFIRF